MALLSMFLMGDMAPHASADELYEQSGTSGLYNELDQDTRNLLDGLGVDSGVVTEEISGEGIWDTISSMVRDTLFAPAKSLAALTAVGILARLCECFEDGDGMTEQIGILVCGVILSGPLLGLISTCQRVTDTAAAFLGAAVPVYAGLLGAAGQMAVGSGYSFWAMLAGEILPVLSTGFLLPVLRIYLALSIATVISGAPLARVPGMIYSLSKWSLVTLVTIYTGVLSVQTALNAQVDAATNKAAKLAISTGVPIVGGALGDAVAAIQNSIHIVKSGAGAFGILAVLCIFAPVMIECLLWLAICLAGQTSGELLGISQFSGLLGVFSNTVKMILAILASICVVCIASAAAIIFAGAGG